MLNRIISDNGNFVSAEKAQECIHGLTMIFGRFECHKGCGEVLLKNLGYGPICSECGEELDRGMTKEFIEAFELLIPITENED